ncbi:MAG: hypothetical protein CL669_05605 [Balneola sp.]|nr:hypothetical protein [Balneola sp.]
MANTYFKFPGTCTVSYNALTGIDDSSVRAQVPANVATIYSKGLMRNDVAETQSDVHFYIKFTFANINDTVGYFMSPDPALEGSDDTWTMKGFTINMKAGDRNKGIVQVDNEAAQNEGDVSYHLPTTNYAGEQFSNVTANSVTDYLVQVLSLNYELQEINVQFSWYYVNSVGAASQTQYATSAVAGTTGTIDKKFQVIMSLSATTAGFINPATLSVEFRAEDSSFQDIVFATEDDINLVQAVQLEYESFGILAVSPDTIDDKLTYTVNAELLNTKAEIKAKLDAIKAMYSNLDLIQTWTIRFEPQLRNVVNANQNQISKLARHKNWDPTAGGFFNNITLVAATPMALEYNLKNMNGVESSFASGNVYGMVVKA